VELSIDTSTDTASIALSASGMAQSEMSWTAGQNHTVELMPNIIHLLNQAKIDIAQVKAIIVAIGPGSFNGLRVGVGTAKGLAFALEIPLIGIGTLEVEAYPYAPTALPICPLQPAGRGEIATATFQQVDGIWRRLAGERITTIDELCKGIDTTTIFCGRFPEEASLRLKELLGERAIVYNKTMRRAGSLAELGWRRLERGEADEPAILQPLYLRRPAITKPRKGKR
jgi:tRNA threonylcarbamoyl adenosine modification protein YeaZ